MKEECKHKTLICKTDGKPPVCSKCGIKYIEPPEEEASKKIISKYPEIKRVLEDLCESLDSGSEYDQIDCPSAYRQIEELIDKNYNLIIDKTNLSATPPFQKSVPKEEKCECALEINKKCIGHASYCPLFIVEKPALKEDVIEDWDKRLLDLLEFTKEEGIDPDRFKCFIKQEIKKARGDRDKEILEWAEGMMMDDSRVDVSKLIADCHFYDSNLFEMYKKNKIACGFYNRALEDLIKILT